MIKLPDGPSFLEPESEIALNQWIDLVIEYELGRIRIVVNGKGKTYVWGWNDNGQCARDQ